RDIRPWKYAAKACLHRRLTPALAAQQILHQRLIEVDASIHRHIVDAGARAVFPVAILELLQMIEIGSTLAEPIDRKDGALIRILHLVQPLEREMDLGFIENMEDDDVVATVTKMVQRLSDRLGIREQIAEQHDQ